MASIREESVLGAVNFLKDPKVQKSTLQSRVSFLESKGLTSEEIEEALRRVKGGDPFNATTVAPPQPIQGVNPGQVIYAQPPAPPPAKSDWRDYFIAAVLFGGIGYAIGAVVKKYLLPLLKTPTANELESDKQALSDQFTFTSERLDSVKTDANIVRRNIEETSLSVKEALESLDTVLKDLKQQEIKRDIDIKSLQEEVKTIHELIPKILEKSKDSQNQALADLQTELKSLRSLIINRPNLTTSFPNVTTGASFDGIFDNSIGETNGAKPVVEASSDSIS
ncbi:12169_t:CDS:2 [Ambispora gerdemannii]|uniref:Peroxisomal membrane protein PEX14 n=1 Tax=Ambispora gerdemannii TaxID=144530 RepID=A0A9N9FLS4_9GLOM|nr:12169_t:CDS:2 [Ambispora gerdemannii]